MTGDDAAAARAALERTFRAEHGRVVAAVARRFSDLDLAEDAAAEAFAVAAERWATDFPEVGAPPNPGGWLTTTAVRRALDRVRREAQRDPREQRALREHVAVHGRGRAEDHAAEVAEVVDAVLESPEGPDGVVADDRLRLLFTCCHPALPPEARVALTLRLVAGLAVEEVAAAFLVPTTTMAQRLTRAKRKVRDARIPLRVPGAADVAPRLETVTAVVELVLTEGHLASGDGEPVRDELCAEATRLARTLRELLAPLPADRVPERARREVDGLLALCLLTEARRPARVSADGVLVVLADQDRSLWDAGLVAEGHALVRSCLAAVATGGPPPGPLQVQAAIAAVHTDAPTADATDWGQLVQLHDQLLRLRPTPTVALDRAVAVAQLDGPEVGLALVEPLGGALASYHPFHVVRAELLRRCGRWADAGRAYDDALALVRNSAERSHLLARRAHLRSAP